MFVCNRCNQEFKYKCRYQQHINRKTQCQIVDSVGEYDCIYCFSKFKNDKTLNKHKQGCKHKHDHVRQMEIALGIKVVVSDEPHMCRFCKCTYSRQNNLTVHLRVCKEKDKYQKLLEEKLALKHKTSSGGGGVTTNNINNGTIMNISVNPLPFGQENKEYLTKDTILKLWEHSNNTPELFVSRLIAIIHTNPKHPENHNVIYSNARSRHARVFNGTEYELQFIDQIIEQASTNSLDHVMSDLYDPASQTGKRFKTILDACEPVDIDGSRKKEMIAQARLALYNNCPKMKRSQVAEAIPFDTIYGIEQQNN